LQSPKKVGDDICAATKDWKGLKVTVKLTIQNRKVRDMTWPDTHAWLHLPASNRICPPLPASARLCPPLPASARLRQHLHVALVVMAAVVAAVVKLRAVVLLFVTMVLMWWCSAVVITWVV
jgi:hypothetical protein